MIKILEQQSEKETKIRENWDESWKAGHLPHWFKKRVRAVARERKDWKTGFSVESYLDGVEGCKYLWDHMGSVEVEGGRGFVTQPYLRGDNPAKAFAETYGMKLIVIEPSTYHHKASTFIFTER
jgi:hypothetical protein